MVRFLEYDIQDGKTCYHDIIAVLLFECDSRKAHWF